MHFTELTETYAILQTQKRDSIDAENIGQNHELE